LESYLDRQGVVRRLGERRGEAEVLGEERAQVAPDDLCRRPPERLGVHDRGRAFGANESRREPGEQEPAQDGTVWGWLHWRASVGRDGARHGVRLLRREAALLDRRLGQVSGRIDVSQAEYPAQLVGRDEPGLVLGNALDPGPYKLRKCDHGVGRQLA